MISKYYLRLLALALSTCSAGLAKTESLPAMQGEGVRVSARVAALPAATRGPNSGGGGPPGNSELRSEATPQLPIYLWRSVPVPAAFRVTHTVAEQTLTYGGDIRLGDLRNTGTADFIVYRAAVTTHKDGGTKPVFLGAFDQEGREIWSRGSGGYQPGRPVAVAIHDIDGDGRTEVIHLWKDPNFTAAENNLGDVSIQIRDGATGALKKDATPATLPAVFRNLSGSGAQWLHQRLLICNLRGLPTPRDFVLKVGDRLFAFDEEIRLLWTYAIPFNRRPEHSAYIPAVGDIDGDGRDEVTGGRYLLDHDGSVMFEDTAGAFTPHMDSVAIIPWDNGRMRVLASGAGHVIDAAGKPVLSLGKTRVPHGQEARVARFIEGRNEPQMVLRWSGHSSKVLTVDVRGNILRELTLNYSPNGTGMEAIYWHGSNRAALLYNGGMLWNPVEGWSWALPGLPPLQGPNRMGWYHCIPADLDGDGREEVVAYNPWDDVVHLYGATPAPSLPAKGFVATARQYNVRLMD